MALALGTSTHAAREIERCLDDLGRLRQRRVDRRRVRVHELRPARVPEPERAAAPHAEAPLGLRAPRALARLAEQRVIAAEVLLAAHLERVGGGAEVDRVAAAAGGLAADRAMAVHERHRAVRFEAEANGAAMAGAFEVHGWRPGMGLHNDAARDACVHCRHEHHRLHRRRQHGQAIVGGLCRGGRPAASIVVVDPEPAQRERLAGDVRRARARRRRRRRFASAGLVVWAVKPQAFRERCRARARRSSPARCTSA